MPTQLHQSEVISDSPGLVLVGRGDTPALLEGPKDVAHSTRRPPRESLPFKIHRIDPKVPGITQSWYTWVLQATQDASTLPILCSC